MGPQATRFSPLPLCKTTPHVPPKGGAAVTMARVYQAFILRLDLC